MTALVVIGVSLYTSHSGFDLTDEGFYFNWIASPWRYKASISQFGFVYHPLYVLCDGDVANLRRLNLLITLALSYSLSLLVIRKFMPELPSSRSCIPQGLAIALSSSSLLLTCFELPQSLSYNSLAFQAILLAGSGVVLAESRKRTVALLGYLLIGVGCWLAFMAKPSTALALGLVVCIYIVVCAERSIRGLALSALTALVLLGVSAFLIDGAIQAFVLRFQQGLILSRTLSSNNSLQTIVRWEPFPLESGRLYLLIATTILLSASLLAVMRSKLYARRSSLVLAVIAFVTSLALMFDQIPINTPFARFSGLAILTLPLAGLVTLAFRYRIVNGKWRHAAFAVFLLTLPFVYAFGTDRPYWLNAEGASIFWILAGIAVLALQNGEQIEWSPMLQMTSLSVFVTALFIASNQEFPMRQTQPLRLHREPVGVGTSGHRLFMGQEFAQYINRLRVLAESGGFAPETPLIDLTGSSPGVIYLLGASAPGAAWLLGGYKGSGEFAAAALDFVPCQVLASAWLLVAPSGPANLPTELLKRYGINGTQDYQDLGTATRPPTPFPDRHLHHLLKPLRSEDAALSACTAERAKRP